MNFKKLFLFFAIAAFAGQTFAMENQPKSLSRWQQVTQYKYPALLGLGVFVSGAAGSYVKGVFAENFAKIACASLAITTAAMTVQSLCGHFFNNTKKNKENKDSAPAQTQEDRGSVVINENADDTKTDISNPDLKPDLIGLIKLQLSQGVVDERKQAIIQKIDAEYSGELASKLKIAVNELYNALQYKLWQKKAKVCAALNKIGAFASPTKAIVWNEVYEKSYAQLREWIADDIERVKQNKPVIHAKFICDLDIMQDHPQLKNIALFYEQIKAKSSDKLMQWFFIEKNKGFNNYFGWDGITFEWPKKTT